jgi:hypothetical protein
MSDISIVKEQYERYIYARDNGHTKFLDKAERCDAFYNGEQWNAADKAKLARQRRPALTLNKLLPSVAAIQGQQLNNRSDVSFRPKDGGNAETAMALDKLWLHVSNTNNLDTLESDVFTDGIITSRGFYDVRMDFDDNIYGDVRIKLLNPYNVILDPDAEEYDPKRWKEVWLTKWLSHDDIERIYGKDVARQLKGKVQSRYEIGYDFVDKRYGSFGGSDRRVGDEFDPDATHRRRFRVLERQHRTKSIRPHFVDVITGETRVIPENWGPEKIAQAVQAYNLQVIKRPYEEIKWTVTIDDVLAHDEKSPYNDFTIVPYFPFFRHGTTIGLVENMIDPQELYNKTKSQELHVINSTANGGWQGEEGQLANMTEEELEHRGAETGLVIMRKKGTLPLEKIQPNQIPSGLDRIGFMAAEDLKEISMASDSLRGFDREDVAAKAIMTKQAMGASNFAMPLHNLQRTRGLLAARVLDLIQQYYTEERAITVTKSDLAAQPETLTVNQMSPEGEVLNNLQAGEYEVVLTTVPARNTFEESQFQQAKELRELGIMIPDDILIENSTLYRKHEIAKRLKEMQGGAEQSPEQQQAAQIELQIRQLEGQKMAAETRKIEAEAVLALVRAQDLAEGETNDGGLAEMQKMQNENERFLAQSEMDMAKLDKELEFKYAELGQKQREADHKASMDRANVLTNFEAARRKADTEDRKTQIAAHQAQTQRKAADKPAPKSASKK